ncbi:MAG: hypothetical protein AB2551_10005 [Candidatus Thiodiazotropha sp.]
MNRFFNISVGLATIAALGVATFQLGKSQASQSAESIKITIDNTINEVIGQVSQENREGVVELLHPLSQLIDSNLREGKLEPEVVEKTAVSLQKNLQQLSLQSYRADISPFVPPLNKAQFLCSDAFTLAYMGQDSYQQLHAKLKINSNVTYLRPGDINQYKADDKMLEITYLEYKRDLKGPFLKYECHDRIH